MNNIVEVGNLIVFEGKSYSVLRLHKGFGNKEVTAVLRGENGQTMEVLKRILESVSIPDKKIEKPIDIEKEKSPETPIFYEKEENFINNEETPKFENLDKRKNGQKSNKRDNR